FDAEMADGRLFRLASFLDGFKDGLENFAGDRFVAWEDRTLGYVIETTLAIVCELQHQGAPDDAVPPLEDRSEMFISLADSKIGPPGRLHETGLGCRLQ